MKRGRGSVWAILVGTAAYVTFGVIRRSAQQGSGELAYDFYGLFYPNITYAVQSIGARGHGLLWSPYQACGIPFLANTEVGLFYPGHLVFALLPREAALLASVLLHLTVAGLGAFLLCREVGLGRPAALTGALAFQLGVYTVQFAGWSPIHLATYAWMSVAAWRAERLVRAPGTRNAAVLAVVLTLQLLAGFVQISHLTYQLIAARVVWAAITGEEPRPLALVGHAALALVLAPALAGVQLVPAVQMVRESIRGHPLGPHDIGPGFTWHLLVATAWSQLRIPFNVLGVCLAVASLRAGRTCPLVAFHALVVAVCLVLSAGPGSGLWELWARLPFAASFRGPARVLWVAYLSAAVLTACGADTLAGRIGRAAWVLPAAMLANALVFGSVPVFGYRLGDVYERHAGAFAFVRARMTPQDRVYLVGKPDDPGLAPKSASWFRIPGIYDYEAEPPRRYAEFFAYLLGGRPLERLSDWHWIRGRELPATLQRPLFDRTAARFVLVDRDLDRVPDVLPAGTRRLAEVDGVRIYENEAALPRARWVPTAVVVPDPEALRALASGTQDPRRTVLLDRAAGGGGPDASGGTATITTDDPERVVVRVHGPAPGLLVLADAFYPGWAATVNGERREIVRADFAFRAVAVPAGDSEVVFAYRPVVVPLGALVSLVAGVVLVALVRAR